MPKLPLRSWTSLPRPLLLSVAVLFCASTTLYAIVWMYDVRSGGTMVELGFNKTHDEQYDQRTHSVLVGDVVQDSPAEKAGLRAGDRIIGVNGKTLTTSAPYDDAYARGRPGDPVEFTIARHGEPEPLTIHGIFRASQSVQAAEGLAKSSAQQIVSSFPVLFLLVGFAVLFLRPDDSNAWLLALMFSAFAAAPSLTNPLAVPPLARAFASAFRAVFQGLLCSLFYFFFAVFPVRSPLDRRFAWLKWAGLAVAATTVFPGLRTGNPMFPQFLLQLAGTHGSQVALRVFNYGFLALGLVSLAQNAFSAAIPPEARRKSKVILFGTVVGVLPIVVKLVAKDFGGYQPSFWVDTGTVIILILYPLSFAYAVVKHRVLEIPVLLRRSARYVLVQRGYFLLLFCGALLAIFLFARFFSGYFAQNSQFGMALSAAFGVALVWVSGPFVKRGTDRIDRAFFRSSYDARIILQDLAEKIRRATDRHELARLLELHIEGALHPQSLACYLETRDGNLAIEPRTVPRERGTTPQAVPRPKFPFRFGARFVLRDADTIPATLPLLTELARHGKAWDVPPPVADEAGDSGALAPECLVPILGRDSKLIGLLVLGGRLSEEPYSSEDKRLLDSVAGQAAVSLENMRLAEQMADRIEADRRAAHEMEIARDVQSRLFPQVLSRLATLEYAGSCIQARQVGGDYYDFWDLGSSHLALVLADISGKGISGALLMANLQANLRSRSAVAREDLFNLKREGKWLPDLLKSVNQLFYENTPDDRFATLFLAVYDDTSRQLEYANCGHNPPLLFRASGKVEQLCATASVIGFSPHWECATQNITLQPNDVLVIYTDGVTEANDADGNEFGEARLTEIVRANLCVTPAELLTAIQQAVQKFSAGEQFDDLTLVVARAR
ncbi:MAG TPA: SpoIIE family protein phosphatase [Candidatus Sulfotelmatobacter sp.]|nr:SpoIIE family protein phosphatase [Candidatus Sulfotelmatobacter sp.]